MYTYNNPLKKYKGIQYCRINQSTSVIFDTSKTSDKSTIENIDVYLISIKSNNKYDITRFISRDEALIFINELIEYFHYYKLWIEPSRCDECNHFISQMSKLYKMIEKENAKNRAAELKKEREKIERELLFTIKMVDTEKDKDEARKLHKEKLKKQQEEERLKRRMYQQEPYVEKIKRFLNDTADTSYDYPETKYGHIGYCTIDSINDAYNEYCTHGDYTDYEEDREYGIYSYENIEPLIDYYMQSKWFIDAYESIRDFDDVDELTDLLRSIDPDQYTTKRTARLAAERIIEGLIF